MKQSQKDEIYNIIVKNRFSIFNRKDKESAFVDFLLKNNIFFDFNVSIREVIKFLKNIDDICQIDECINERVFVGIRQDGRTEYGFKKFCSTKCYHKYLSNRQIGKNNTCHRMTSESFNSMREKNSNIMKLKIKNGEFTPNITNSWCSYSYLIMNGLEKRYRSSWEAFYQLCNPALEYEKLRITYTLEGKLHTYIVDFVDHINKKVFEIKPNSQKEKKIVKIKEKQCRIWCDENKYDFLFISDNWYFENFKINKHLLLNQPNGKEIIKKLKQFDEN